MPTGTIPNRAPSKFASKRAYSPIATPTNSKPCPPHPWPSGRHASRSTIGVSVHRHATCHQSTDLNQLSSKVLTAHDVQHLLRLVWLT
jgi:hypothetical protein